MDCKIDESWKTYTKKIISHFKTNVKNINYAFETGIKVLLLKLYINNLRIFLKIIIRHSNSTSNIKLLCPLKYLCTHLH